MNKMSIFSTSNEVAKSVVLLALLTLGACAPEKCPPPLTPDDCILSHAYRDVMTGEITCQFAP